MTIDLDLNAALRLLDAIVQANPNPMFVKDASGIYLLANTATADALRTGSVEALIGRRDADLSQKPAAQVAQSSDATVLATNQALSIEVELGGRRYSCRKTPWRDAEGRAIGIIGFVTPLD
jgi:PAS domain-containing protein